MHNDVEKILFSEEELKKICQRLGKQITKAFEGQKVLVVGVLKGSFIFLGDLVKNIDGDLNIDFIDASSYYNGTQTTSHVTISKDLSIDPDGKCVLIVEDIVDSGNTANFLVDYMKAKNAKDVKFCTLFDKPKRRQVAFTPDYIGASVDDNFIVGYGLDYAENYRHLPYIGILKESVYL